MKQWIVKIELVADFTPKSFRAKVSLRGKDGRLTSQETVYPKETAMYKLLKLRNGKMYALMRLARNKTIHFVREEIGPSW